MMSSPEKILVLGLGELGLPVTTHIANIAAEQDKQTTVSVLLRPSSISDPSPTRAQELDTLKGLGVRLVAADLASSSKASLTTIFKDYDCIVSCTGFVGGPESILKVVHAVLDARVPYFIPWQFGVDYDQVGYGSAQKLWDTQLDVRRLLRSQTQTQWTIVQTGIFTSFLFEPWFEIVDLSDKHQPIVRALGGLDNKVSTTSPDDIGRVTATVVFDPVMRNQIVKCAGDTISYGDLASIMHDTLEKPVHTEVLKVEDLEHELSRSPQDNIKMYQVAFAKGIGCHWAIEDTINFQHGMGLQTMRDFAKEKFANRAGVLH